MAYQTYSCFPGLCFRQSCVRSDRNFGATLTAQKNLHAQLYYRICWGAYRMPLATWDRFVGDRCAHNERAPNQTGPIEMPLCRMRYLLLHTQRFPSLIGLYIQNE
jgi:hypothetical protein